MNDSIYIHKELTTTPEATELLEALSNTLQQITGASGKASFNMDDLKDDKAFFAVARNTHEEAIGCGAVRTMDAQTGEVKRVYAKEKGKGIGGKILRFLEEESRKLGYQTLRLETRRINKRAVQFYLSKGYKEIPNYGHYQNRPEAICFEKSL